MLFQPIDEMSLRHLFSSELGKKVLKMSYWGPVLNITGKIEQSPDAIILDMRKSPYTHKRAEFKFFRPGENHSEFARNGQFDVAIIWSLPDQYTAKDLLGQLTQQNGCSDLVILNTFGEFSKLPKYELSTSNKIPDFQDMEKYFTINPDKIIVAYIAAKLYPERLNLDRTVDYLSKKLSNVAAMGKQGRANVVTALVQTKPALLQRMGGKGYEWTGRFDNAQAADLLENWIRVKLRMDAPTQEHLTTLID